MFWLGPLRNPGGRVRFPGRRRSASWVGLGASLLADNVVRGECGVSSERDRLEHRAADVLLDDPRVDIRGLRPARQPGASERGHRRGVPDTDAGEAEPWAREAG